MMIFGTEPMHQWKRVDSGFIVSVVLQGHIIHIPINQNVYRAPKVHIVMKEV
jgi:hypothetical protein